MAFIRFMRFNFYIQMKSDLEETKLHLIKCYPFQSLPTQLIFLIIYLCLHPNELVLVYSGTVRSFFTLAFYLNNHYAMLFKF